MQERGAPRSVKDLESHRWITLTQTAPGGLVQLRSRGKAVQVQPTDYYQCNSPLMVQQMVLAGLGIGALFETTVKHELKRAELQRVLPSVGSEAQVFYLVYPSRRHVPRRTRVLIDFLLQGKIFD